ncbi:hypothetical protein DFP73DRAFT_618306 [Morchella snyderi]|nr:hypothetical protein DFP73DRAFT_618306 [Morchella snyderi]
MYLLRFPAQRDRSLPTGPLGVLPRRHWPSGVCSQEVFACESRSVGDLAELSRDTEYPRWVPCAYTVTVGFPRKKLKPGPGITRPAVTTNSGTVATCSPPPASHTSTMPTHNAPPQKPKTTHMVYKYKYIANPPPPAANPSAPGAQCHNQRRAQHSTVLDSQVLRSMFYFDLVLVLVLVRPVVVVVVVVAAVAHHSHTLFSTTTPHRTAPHHCDCDCDCDHSYSLTLFTRPTDRHRPKSPHLLQLQKQC